MPMSLDISQLNLYFGDRHVLSDVALRVEPGHILALIGPRGAGKTTLLRVVNRMAEMQGAQVSGSIMLDNSSIFMMQPDELRTKVGMVMSEPVIFPGTVFDNICAGLRLHGVLSRSARMQAVERALKELGVYTDYYPLLAMKASVLSEPQKQIVCICRALAMEPQFLLMDEPTRPLDPVSVMRVEEALTNLKKKCSLLMSTRTLQQAGRIADETALLMDGEVVEWGRTGDLLSHPRKEKTEQYITGRYL